MSIEKFSKVVSDFAAIKKISYDEAWEIIITTMVEHEDHLKKMSEERM